MPRPSVDLDRLLQLPDAKALAVLKQLKTEREREVTKGDERLERAVDSVFDTWAPAGEWLPQEMVWATALVRLKAPPKQFTATKERVLSLLKRLEGKRFHTEK